jgi:hypothetical protein
MNWDAIGAGAELLGAIGVILTLVYVAKQIQQNTGAMRSLTHQQLFDTTVEVNDKIADDPILAALIAKASTDFDSLSNEEYIRLQYLYANFFTLWHSAYTNNQAGFLTDNAWTVWDNGTKIMLSNQSVMRRIWEDFDGMYDEDFRAYANKIIGSLGEAKAGPGILKSK